MRRTIVLLPLALALWALAAACGGGDSNGDETPTRAPATGAATSTRASATATPPAATAEPASATPTPVAGGPSPHPTRPPAQPTSPAPPPSATQPPPPAVSLTLAGEGNRFKPNSLTAPANATVTFTFDNRDAGITHDIVFFDPSGARIGESELLPGPVVQTFTFTTGAPGSYGFRCSVHLPFMSGTLTVQ